MSSEFWPQRGTEATEKKMERQGERINHEISRRSTKNREKEEEIGGSGKEEIRIQEETKKMHRAPLIGPLKATETRKKKIKLATEITEGTEKKGYHGNRRLGLKERDRKCSVHVLLSHSKPQRQ